MPEAKSEPRLPEAKLPAGIDSGVAEALASLTPTTPSTSAPVVPLRQQIVTPHERQSRCAEFVAQAFKLLQDAHILSDPASSESILREAQAKVNAAVEEMTAYWAGIERLRSSFGRRPNR